MRTKIGIGVVVIAAAIAIGWWWHGRATSARARSPAASSSSSGGGADRGGAIAHPSTAPARLEGKVTGVGGVAVPGAVVQATTRDQPPSTIATRADGTFGFDALPPGTYLVTASAAGFLSAHQDHVALRRGQTTRVELALAPGGTAVRGTVVDASGGPIAGAVISAWQWGPMRRSTGTGGAAITDGNGQYVLSLASGPYRVSARHPEYVPANAELLVAAIELTLDFRLMPGGAIEGVVMDVATGAPLPGATVTVDRERLGDDDRRWDRRGTTAVSGDDGHFRATGLGPGTLTVSAEDEGAGQQSSEPVIVSLGIGEQVDGVELWVSAAPYVTGRVLDDKGAPVADAFVVATGPGFQNVQSDADGGFRFAAMKPGEWRLSAAGDHSRPAGQEKITVADKPVTDVVLKVAPASRIVGRVEPAVAADVSIEYRYDADSGRDWDAASMISPREAQAGADGHFEVGPVKPGKYELTARSDDGRRGKLTVVVPATTGDVEAVIALDTGASLAGRVVDQDGAPVPGAVVKVGAEVGERGPWLVNGVDRTAADAPVEADGRFARAGLAAGTYRLDVVDDHGGLLRAARGGQERATTTVELAEREQKTGIVLAVERNGGTIRGVVRGADGAPRADAWVIAAMGAGDLAKLVGSGRGTEWASTQEDASGVGGTPPVLTDGAGRFELHGLRRGVYVVSAEAERGGQRGRTSGVATGSDTVVTIAGLATIAGTVTSGGAPVDDFTVAVIAPQGAGRRQQRFRGAGGRFRFPRIDPGRYQVRVITATGSGDTDVTAEADRTAQVELDVVGDLATAHGQIVDGAGKGVSGVSITARPTAGGKVPGDAVTNGYGRFDLDVAAGSYLLVVDGVATDRAFTATDGQTVMIEPSIARPTP